MFFCEFCKNFKSIFWQNSSGWPLLVLICEILEVFRFFFFVFFFLLLFSFSIRVFFHRHWQFTGQLGKGGNYVLFHLTTSTRSRTLRHLFATLHVRWLSRIFNRNACACQAATRWDLPLSNYHLIELPFDWLLDDAMFVCLLDELILAFCYNDLTWETGGFELASTITLALQANRLTKWASHPIFIKRTISQVLSEV